jgi:hypothetical protein
MGTIGLAIPRVRLGDVLPDLQPRRRADNALLAVVQEAYVHGVSTRKIDDIEEPLGLDGTLDVRGAPWRVRSFGDRVPHTHAHRRVSLPLGWMPRVTRCGPRAGSSATPRSSPSA